MADVQLHPSLGIEWRDPVMSPARNADYEHRAKRLTGGQVPIVLSYITPCDWITRAFLANLSLQYSYADLRIISLIALVASNENGCRYCLGHQRAALRIQGLSETQIEHLTHDLELAELSDASRSALDFARALARSRPRPARQAADGLVAKGFDRLAVAEIVGEVANWCLGNRVATMLAVPPERKLEGMVDSFLGKLLRPLLARQLRKARVAGAPPTPCRVDDVPYGPVLEPMAATHIGQLFHDGLRGAFASDVLPRRSKALAFGVVARALECPGCEGESRRVAGEAGVGASEVDSAFERLVVPSGDPAEQAIVAFARDTVRYRPAELQDRTRALLGKIGPARTLETVAITALANAIVRIAMLQA